VFRRRFTLRDFGTERDAGANDAMPLRLRPLTSSRGYTLRIWAAGRYPSLTIGAESRSYGSGRRERAPDMVLVSKRSSKKG
jgi:hypothetical protein